MDEGTLQWLTQFSANTKQATASAGCSVVLFKSVEKVEVLMVYEHLRPMWKIVSGWMEASESVSQTAKREVYEECGLAIDAATIRVLRVTSKAGTPNHLGVDLTGHILDGTSVEPKVVDTKEVKSAKWVHVDDLRKVLENGHHDQENTNPFLHTVSVGDEIYQRDALILISDAFHFGSVLFKQM
jgi:NADH pyrophosphatase NudC (nudix superfamily)